MIKVQNGTRSDTKAICKTCAHGVVARGSADSNEFIHCGFMGKRITMVVTECNKYIDSSQPSLYDLREIAWVLETSKNRNVIGFTSPQDWADKSRNSLPPSR